MSLGFSHPVAVTAPEGISFQVAANKVIIEGIDKALVGLVGANVKKIRPPDVYKGKGIRYEGEQLIKKAGKQAKTAGGA